MGRTARTMALVISGLLWSGWASARTTVAVAPFSTAASQEYHWLGAALAEALTLRVHRQPELNVLTQRQINAAMRHDNLTPQDLTQEAAAQRLGQQLGAHVLITGSYEAVWPDLTLILKVHTPQQKGAAPTKQVISGGLEDVFDLEARVARAAAKALGAEQPQVDPGAFGTTNLRAWRLTALALEILNWQSLSPSAANASTPLNLPESALKKAGAYLADAVRHDPDYGEAWAGVGVVQALSGKSDLAWRAFGKATALGFGHDPTAVLGASFVRMREGRWNDAARILASAVERHPGFLHARGYLGELYLARGDFQNALEVFNAYAQLVPGQPWVLAQRGYAKAKLGDTAGAIADTTAAVDLLPSSAYLRLELASRYIDAGKLLGAEDALKQAIQSNPNASTAYVRLGYVYLLQGKDDLVVPITQKALANATFARSKDRGYAHLNLARAYGHQGKLDNAFEHLGQAKALGASLAEVQTDPRLEALRKDGRFAKLRVN